MNYILNINKLDMIEAVTKAHIAMDIISNKTNEKQLLKQFNSVKWFRNIQKESPLI